MTNLKYVLFLGCVIPYRETSYEISARIVAKTLGISFKEMTDFNCCGLPIDPVNHDLMMLLAARNICMAEKMGLNLMTLCNGCTGVLKSVNKKLKADKALREKVNEQLSKIGMKFEGKIEIKHFVNILAEDLGYNELKKFIVKPLNQLKIAGFHGCHIFRPSKVMEVNDPENPSLLTNLIEITGAKSVHYINELQCCGASCGLIDSRVPLLLGREKLKNVKKAGADAMVTICPSCHVVFDANQPTIERTFSETYEIPILHYPQLLGLAMGIDPAHLALKDLRVTTNKVLNKVR